MNSNVHELIAKDDELLKKVKKVIYEFYNNTDSVASILSSTDPNAWDGKIKILREQLHYPVYRATSTFDYDKCFSYQMLLHRDVVTWESDSIVPIWQIGESDDGKKIADDFSGEQHWLWLYISALGPFYTYQHEIRTLPAKPGLASNSRSYPYGAFGMLPETAEIVKNYFASYGYHLLGEDILQRRVLNVSLELSEPDEVTVLKCLFFDYDSLAGEKILSPI